jgi:rubrerythrin
MLLSKLAKLRQAPVWKDPYRKYRTLLSFSETEEDGGKDLVRASRRVTDPDLRKHIERHSKDEVRHANLFRERAAEVASESNFSLNSEMQVDKPYDLSGARRGLQVDAHGFFNAGLIDELGELEYVAMLHVAECKAAELFEMYHELNQHDPKTRGVFAEILKDEKYHVAYTKTFLDKWRKQGRGAEIDKALKTAKGNRLIGAWKAFGLRSGSGFSHTVLFVLYWTLMAPFGVLSRPRKVSSAWKTPRSATSAAARAGQY